MPRPYFSFLLAFLVFLTQVGVPVYTHVCRGQEKTWHSIAVRAESCCPAPEARTGWGEAGPESGLTIRETPCCEDYTALAALDTDYTKGASSFLVKSWPCSAAVLPTPGVAPELQAVFASAFHSFRPHAPPPRRWGRSLLIFKSVFRC
jgi:hypothetical protein